ncbi:MAG: LiaF domain-containing protein [Bacteroidota bacterium]|jgi:hypothetical protein
MKNSKLFRLILLFGTACTVVLCAYARQTNHREFSRTHEKEVRVILDISFASITIERGESDKIAVVDYDEEESNMQKLYISYDISHESGTLHIKLKESTHFWGDDEGSKGHRNHLDIKLGDTVPISFEIELGAGKGEIDLTDLQVKEFNISTGASSVTMKCGKPNPISADDISIESGVSKFTAMDLGNLNFHNLKFSGGVGSYKLDFDGKFRQSAEVQIEIGLGSINVYVPKSIPAKLVYDDNWLSSFSLDDDFEKTRKGVYETADFQDSSKRLTIRMEAGLGSVRIHRK